MIEDKRMSRSVRGIAVAHDQAILVDSERLPACSSERPELGRIAVYKFKGVECVVAGAQPADDLPSVVDAGLQVRGNQPYTGGGAA